MSERKTKKKFTLMMVRHGEGIHNLGIHARNDLEFTDDLNLRAINCALTEKGLMQANLVADRLKSTNFDLAISSDLKRAMQTAEAIMNKNDSINELISWRIVRERCLGEFEGITELYRALRVVENAVSDREYLTWSPPNGESVIDLRNRIMEFLQELQKAAMKVPSDFPIILVSSHGLFMEELYYVLSTSEYGKTIPKKMPGYQNTGISQYNFTTSLSNNNECILEDVECTIFSCANHLENHDQNYMLCRGGCHGVKDDVKIREIDEQPR